MPYGRSLTIRAGDVASRFSKLTGDRLAIALVGEFAILAQVAETMHAINLNATLLNAMADAGTLEDAYETEEIGDTVTLRRRLETVFREFLKQRAGQSRRTALWGLETLVHFGVNLRSIREFAVNDTTIGLLMPGTVQNGAVRLYGKHALDCDFDQVWEVTP